MQKILVIGASSGIGYALVKALRAQGFDTIAAGRRQALLETLGGAYVQMDITSPAAMDQITKIAPDTIIFNAGFGHRTPEPDADLTRKAIELNIIAFERTAQWALQHCTCFAAVGSIAGLRGMENTNGYSPSKAYLLVAMEAYRRKIRREGKPCRFISIIPGFVDTAMGQASTFWRCSPEVAATCICKGLMKCKPIIYVTQRWYWIAVLLKWTPRWIYESIG